MTIPTRPLEVDYDPRKMTLGELALFDVASGLNEFQMAMGVRSFLINHTKWTQAEVDTITIEELTEVGEQLGKAIRERALPKGRRKHSANGRASRQKADLPSG